MPSKISSSVASSRQIPEVIREQYPAFVDFIKTYYEFLEETQTQDLESYRDVDTTLDQFFDKFKSELTANIPLETVSDKKSFMKRVREFYLSRGSESSYKFLFRTLFGVEPEILYPSKQVLRASDGKWKQETSIFVQITGTTTSLFDVNDKFITIQTPTKTIRTYVSDVKQYSDDIFELFIENTYVSNITEGSSISYTVGLITYTGDIVPCPSSIRVIKAGKGFSVGDRFNLKTSIGDGCLIKVTRVDSNSGIVGVHVIRFALHYETTFWSYLSSKQIEGIEYVSPANIGTGPFAPYKERLNGFIESGFATRQDYLETSAGVKSGTWSVTSSNIITVTISNHGYMSGNTVNLAFTASTGTNASDGSRVVTVTGNNTFTITNPSSITGSGSVTSTLQLPSFVDPSYVGDIVAQFYEDQTQAPTDQDLAIIEVKLGYVAKYPGYYISQDGFVSDESYIHDGSYYQSFSYVIKVEEEFKKYSDIVRALVHPAGMRMFGEYSLNNSFEITNEIPFVPTRLQFASSFTMTDGGANGGVISELPVKFFSKRLTTNIDSTFLIIKSLSKPIAFNLVSQSNVAKLLNKRASSSSSVSTTSIRKTTGKNNSSLANLISAISSKVVNKRNSSAISAISSPSKNLNKRSSSSTTVSTTSLVKSTNKNQSSISSIGSSLRKALSKNFFASITAQSIPSKNLNKRSSSSTTVSTTSLVKSTNKNQSSISSIGSSLRKAVSKSLSTPMTMLSTPSKTLNKRPSVSGISISDTVNYFTAKLRSVSSSINISDSLKNQMNKRVSSTVNGNDTITKSTSSAKQSQLFMDPIGTVILNPYTFEDYYAPGWILTTPQYQKEAALF